MPLTTINSPPALDSFTKLADHQSQTPATFYDAKPVLHFNAIDSIAVTPSTQASNLPLFPEVTDTTTAVQLVNVYVSSENLTLFSQATGKGVSIPYPAISLHAIQRLQSPRDPAQEVQGLYMQLELSDPYQVNDDDEPEVVELTLVPEDGSIQALFEAISNCSNLHPDPTMDEEMEEGEDSRIVFEGSVGYEGISGLPGVQAGAADGGLPPPFPGSGGWITAENVSEYFDADGNWIGGEEDGDSLGEGAGRVRNRDEVDGEVTNGHDEHDDEAKRPRTE